MIRFLVFLFLVSIMPHPVDLFFVLLYMAWLLWDAFILELMCDS